MASRSIWNGTLSFGLVTFPVSLHTATDTGGVSFKQVHMSDGGAVKQRRFCDICDEEVPFAHIAKGYEHESGMVVLKDTDLATLPLPTAKVMDVIQFVSPVEVDPILYSKSYYVKPGKGGGQPFALLSEAMRNTGKVGIAKLALRNRESLAMLRLGEGGELVLIMLLWPDEVRPADKPELTQLAPALVSQAESLVSAMSAKFDPSAHTDGYAAAVVAMVEAKVAGTEAPTAEETAPVEVADLSSVLAASVAAKAKS